MSFRKLLVSSQFYAGICRYALGLYMIPFGVSKILKTQFVVIPVDSWQKTLENTAGTTLAWAFLGYSGWFQILLGIFELLPALLLLFRRTALLGALLLLPVSLNVFLINQALDLWVATKISSAVLLVLNLLVITLHYPVIKVLWTLILQPDKTYQKRNLEWVANIALLIMVGFLIIPELIGYKNSRDQLSGDFINNKPYIWTYGDGANNNSLMNSDAKEIYFFYNKVHRSAASAASIPDQYKIDKDRNMLFITNPKTNVSRKVPFKLMYDSVLILHDQGTETTYFRKIINKSK